MVLAEWQEVLTGNAQGFAEGLEAGSTLVSMLSYSLAVFDPDKLFDPPIPEGFAWDDDGAAFRSGYFIAICAAVVGAYDDVLPNWYFERVRVAGNGKCLFLAACKADGSDPERLRNTVINLLASMWYEQCPAGIAWRAQGRLTVGELLTVEHSCAFAGPSHYRAFMQRSYNGNFPWSTFVEVFGIVSVIGASVRVFSVHGNALALFTEFYPQDGPKPGKDPINLLYGELGTGGVHFDFLKPVDSAVVGALGVSKSAWKTLRHAALAGSIARLVREEQRHLAEMIVGGPTALEALAHAAVSNELAHVISASMLHDDTMAAAQQFVTEHSKGCGAVVLLDEVPQLKNQFAAYLANLPLITPATQLTVAIEQVLTSLASYSPKQRPYHQPHPSPSAPLPLREDADGARGFRGQDTMHPALAPTFALSFGTRAAWSFR